MLIQVLRFLKVSLGILGLIVLSHHHAAAQGNTRRLPPLQITPSAPPFGLEGIRAKFIKNLAYDKHPQNRFDIFLPEAGQPTGLVVYIHGGGFINGRRKDAYHIDNQKVIKQYLKQKIAYATIGYRLLRQADDEGVAKALRDSKRCLQYLRYYAKSLNIDKRKVVLMGHSAGAGTALWLAFHDDMAEPRSADPVARQSTRVLGVAAIETQATYDLLRWETDVFADYGIKTEQLLSASPELAQKILAFYGIKRLELLNSPKVKTYRQQVDMLDMLSADTCEVVCCP